MGGLFPGPLTPPGNATMRITRLSWLTGCLRRAVAKVINWPGSMMVTARRAFPIVADSRLVTTGYVNDERC